MTNENLNSTRPDENLFASLLNEIKGLRAELDDLRKGLDAPKIHLEPDVLYNNKEIRLLLGVDERLIRKYRDNGHLAYIRRSDKYWYKGSDILDFLERSRYPAFA